MQTLIYGSYVLIWPAVTLGVLVLICRAVLRDMRTARKDEHDLV